MSTKLLRDFHKVKHAFPIVGSLIVIGHCVFTTIQRHYSLYTISSFVYADMILVHYCKRAFQQLAPGEKSLTKSLLKFALFVLFSGNLFAIVCQSAPYYGPLTAAMFYAMATGGTAFIFYAYMIYDGEDGCSLSTVVTNSNYEKV